LNKGSPFGDDKLYACEEQINFAGKYNLGKKSRKKLTSAYGSYKCEAGESHKNGKCISEQ